MGLDVWLKSDIENILRATAYMAVQLAKEVPDAEEEAFLRGFRSATVAIALAFGLPEATKVWPDSVLEGRRFLRQDVELLPIETKVIGGEQSP